MKIYTIYLSIAAVLAATPAWAQSAQDVVLQPGDAVDIKVWQRPELDGRFVVRTDGGIGHPLLREVVIGGVPVAEAERRFSTYLASIQITPQFLFHPLVRVSLTGEVRQPNLYLLSPDLGVANAIASAGGATERAELNEVRVIRGGREIVIDLSATNPSGEAAILRSGDRISIPRRVAFVRETLAPLASIVGAVAVLINVFQR